MDLIPYVGAAKGFQQAFTGYNMVTGQQLSTADRWAEGIGSTMSLIPIPGLKHVGKYGTEGAFLAGKTIQNWTGGASRTGSLKMDLQFFASQGTSNLVPTRTKGSGTDLIRYFEKDGLTVQVKSGHGYSRPHKTGDVSSIGTMDEIDTAIVNNVIAAKKSGTSFKPNQQNKYFERSVDVNGKTIKYRVIETPNGIVSVPTYFP